MLTTRVLKFEKSEFYIHWFWQVPGSQICLLTCQTCWFIVCWESDIVAESFSPSVFVAFRKHCSFLGIMSVFQCYTITCDLHARFGCDCSVLMGLKSLILKLSDFYYHSKMFLYICFLKFGQNFEFYSWKLDSELVFYFTSVISLEIVGYPSRN